MIVMHSPGVPPDVAAFVYDPEDERTQRDPYT